MLKQILADQVALLTFRPFRPDLRAHYRAYLAYGLTVTWLAGIGRYRDNPKAEWWQLAGMGSLAYVFVLAALLWLVVAPLRPARWRYRE
jgi:membrane protein YdbS with pleckstrin-like domain